MARGKVHGLCCRPCSDGHWGAELSGQVLMVGTEVMDESVPGLRNWGNSAIGTLQFGREGTAPQGLLIDKSLFLSFQQPNFPG